jgi:hypothetical protein
MKEVEKTYVEVYEALADYIKHTVKRAKDSTTPRSETEALPEVIKAFVEVKRSIQPTYYK